MANYIYIAVDFDGTIVEHEYPFMGRPIHLALETLKDLSETRNVRLILLTMRSGSDLIEAFDFLKGEGIRFYSVNDNPSQNDWTTSRKVYADIYIDDCAFGCPLIEDGFKRPYVDWDKVCRGLISRGILK